MGVYIAEHYRLLSEDACIGLHVLSLQSAQPASTVLYLPGRWQNSAYWAREQPLRDIRIALAQQGFRVATIQYRTAFVRPHRVPSNKVAAWRTEHFLADISLASALLQTVYGVDRTWLVGFSMGSALAFLVNDRLPIHIQGLVTLDGGVKSPEPSMTHSLEAKILEKGHLLNHNPAWDRTFRRTAIRALRGPNTTGMNADMLRLLLVGDPAWPQGQVEELTSLADYPVHPTLHLDRALKKISCPILSVVAGKQVGQRNHRAVAIAGYTASQDVQTVYLPEYRHMDVVAGEDVIAAVNEPVIAWLSARKDSRLP